MVGPEAFMEVKALQHYKQMVALDRIPQIADEFEAAFGRRSGGLVRPYRCEDAQTIVVALGSVLGTIAEAVDELREQGVAVGALGISSFRPFPLDEVRDALAGASQVVVLEKALAVGIGGIVSANVRMALSGVELHGTTVVAGLGGRAITQGSLRKMLLRAHAGELESLEFLDLDTGLVARELERMGELRRSGPHAENILRDLGAVAHKAVQG
jgi:pyruvate ferredoxin oxidoreductase alpha subunit